MNKNSEINRDLPIKSLNEDKLEIKKYIDSLYKFIETCDTPCTISIQGDWGSGKSSVMNCLKDVIESKNKTDNKYHCVYFNTWQYSQFSNNNNLYLTFLTHLISNLKNKKGISSLKCLDKNIDSVQDLLDSMLNIVLVSLETYNKTKPISILIDKLTNKNTYKYHKKNDKFLDNISLIENLKCILENISKCLNENNKKIIIFIDDLDRLEPVKALELLEIIKLFLDLENFVFVLAMDINVVINGVKQKFGKETSTEKCIAFFDKIVQLPFHIPLDKYDYSALIKDLFEHSVKDDGIYNKLSSFIKLCIKSNPRSFNRLRNSYQLLKNIIKQDNKDSQDTLNDFLLLSVIAIQIYNKDLYSFLISIYAGIDENDLKYDNKDITDELNTFIKTNNIEKDSINIPKCIEIISKFNSFILSLNKNKNTIAESLSEVLDITSITSTSNDNVKEVLKIDYVKITKDNQLVNEIRTSKFADAFRFTFKTILEYIDKNEKETIFNDFVKKFENIVLTDDKNKKGGFFNTISKDAFYQPKNKPKIYIGTHSNTKEKIKQINILNDYFSDKNINLEVDWKYKNKRIL